MSESRSATKGAKGQAGFTLLELTVVVVIISTLFLFAYRQYLDLLVDVEKTSMEQTLGILRSAIGLQVAQMVVDGRIGELKNYEGANPLQFLAEVPRNYEGEVSDPRSLGGRGALWYFDKKAGLLIYRVKSRANFFSEIEGFYEARFRLTVIYDSAAPKRFAGLSLRPVERYSWFRKNY